MRKKFGLFVLFIMFVFCWVLLSASVMSAVSAEVTLMWNSVTEASGYKVYYGVESRVYGPGEDVLAETTHTLTLDPGHYWFAVTAYNDWGESGYSEEVDCKLFEQLVIVNATYSSVNMTLTWGAMSEAAGYTVFHGIGSGVYGAGIDVGNVLTYQITLDPGTHYIAVSPYDSDGISSGRSDELIIPIAGPPQGLQVQ